MADDTITATKVCNRALQRVGAGRIADDALFTEDSKSAAECRGCYDILRRAELRRNVWRFSIRRAPLRPVDTTTMVFLPDDWDVLISYNPAAIAKYNGSWWTPGFFPNSAGEIPKDDSQFWTRYFGPTTALPWDATISYLAGELVYVFDDILMVNVAFISLKNANSDATTETLSWQPLLGVLVPFFITYPAGVGPSRDGATRNIYVLPYGYLREAPQNPKAGQASFLGFPSNLAMTDWVFENSFFVSMDSGVIVFRFAADITNASEFDPLFVEGLGARIGMEVCEPLTQSSEKVATCTAAYKTIMGEARIVNGIETSPSQPPLDDYIQTRS